jgi:hypothetical protein
MKFIGALTFFLLLTTQAFGQELSGDWIGGFKQNDRWILVRAQFQQSGNSVNGNLDVVLPGVSTGRCPANAPD